MFYLGGMTLGYLTPHEPLRGSSPASTDTVKISQPSPPPSQSSSYAIKDLPFFRLWHLFH